jgi:predicted transcriptional regulator
MLPETIRGRAVAVRLGKKELSELAHLSQKSTGMILRGDSSPRLNNLQALERAVIAEEIRLRDYLLALHPVVPAQIEEKP